MGGFTDVAWGQLNQIISPIDNPALAPTNQDHLKNAFYSKPNQTLEREAKMVPGPDGKWVPFADSQMWGNRLEYYLTGPRDEHYDVELNTTIALLYDVLMESGAFKPKREPRPDYQGPRKPHFI